MIVFVPIANVVQISSNSIPPFHSENVQSINSLEVNAAQYFLAAPPRNSLQMVFFFAFHTSFRIYICNPQRAFVFNVKATAIRNSRNSFHSFSTQVRHLRFCLWNFQIPLVEKEWKRGKGNKVRNTESFFFPLLLEQNIPIERFYCWIAKEVTRCLTGAL